MGPLAQEALRPWLDRDPDAFCFCPAEVVEARNARAGRPPVASDAVASRLPAEAEPRAGTRAALHHERLPDGRPAGVPQGRGADLVALTAAAQRRDGDQGPLRAGSRTGDHGSRKSRCYGSLCGKGSRSGQAGRGRGRVRSTDRGGLPGNKVSIRTRVRRGEEVVLETRHQASRADHQDLADHHDVRVPTMSKHKQVKTDRGGRDQGGMPASVKVRQGAAGQMPDQGRGAEASKADGAETTTRRRRTSTSKKPGGGVSHSGGLSRAQSRRDQAVPPSTKARAGAKSGAKGQPDVEGGGTAASDVAVQAGGRQGEKAAPSGRQHRVPLVAAYDSAMRLNRLRFLVPQAYLGRKGLLREAKKVLGEFGRAVRDLVPPSERMRLRATVTGPIEAVLKGIADGRHNEYLMECNDELASEGEEVDLVRHREVILKPVFEALDAVRRVIEDILRKDPVAQLAAELGDRIDQGVCPADVHHHLYEPPPPRSKYDGPRRSLSLEYMRKVRLPAEPEIPENLLANVTRRPGSIPPAFDWFADVRKLLDELDLGDAVLHEVDGMAESITAEKIAGVIERIDASVRTALQQRQEGRGAPVGMAAGRRRRQLADRNETWEARYKCALRLLPRHDDPALEGAQQVPGEGSGRELEGYRKHSRSQVRRQGIRQTP